MPSRRGRYEGLALQGAPGLGVAVIILLAPHSNGGAPVVGLAVSVLSVVVAVRAPRARPPARTWPLRSTDPPAPAPTRS